MTKRGRRLVAVWLALLALGTSARSAHASAEVRVKDIAHVQGVRDNDLYGYGLVVGLAGTGDLATSSPFTPQAIANMLRRLGIAIPPTTQLNGKNVAAVIVTTRMPPFVKPGATLDVVVSSLGDATTLQGGTLLLTPLQGPDGQVYALAQGPVSVGGIAASGQSGSSVQKNHPTVGRVPNGALVERQIPMPLDPTEIQLALDQEDFTTAVRLADAVNRAGVGTVARATDASTVAVQVPPAFQTRLPEFIARLEGLTLRVDAPARVIIDERTGTVIMGSDVRIRTVAVAHGNLTIQVREDKQVSQPNSFAPPGSQTVVVPKSNVSVHEDKGRLNMVPEGVSLGDVVQALNALGATPRDLISILQAIKESGALMADLEIM